MLDSIKAFLYSILRLEAWENDQIRQLKEKIRIMSLAQDNLNAELDAANAKLDDVTTRVNALIAAGGPTDLTSTQAKVDALSTKVNALDSALNPAPPAA